MKNIITNRGLNFLFKKKKPSYKSKKNSNNSLILQNKNNNGNYKSMYYFNDENYDENIIINSKNIKCFFFKYFDEENFINKNQNQKNKTINNTLIFYFNNSEIHKNNLTLNKEISINENYKNEDKILNNSNINNSYKIINESKYNNKSKVTISLISYNDIDKNSNTIPIDKMNYINLGIIK